MAPSVKKRRRHKRARAVIAACRAALLLLLLLAAAAALALLRRWRRGGAAASTTTATVFDPSPPPPVLLNDSSMWAAGADARAPGMKRLRAPPLVTWRREAAAAAEAEWRRVQFGDGKSCQRSLYILPFDADVGVMSQVRDVFDIAIVSVFTFGRAVVFAHDDGSLDNGGGIGMGSRPPPPRAPWCTDSARWLECFFAPLSGPACPRRRADLAGAPVADSASFAAAAGPAPLVRLERRSRWYRLLWEPSLFPLDFWSFLVTSNLVTLRHPATGAAVPWARLPELAPRGADAGKFQRRLALSALRSLLAPIIWRPAPELSRAAEAVVASLRPQIAAAAAAAGGGRGGGSGGSSGSGRCVVVHARWTDKASDGGVARALNNSVAHAPAALARIEAASARRYACVLLISDDDEGAAAALRDALTAAAAATAAEAAKPNSSSSGGAGSRPPPAVIPVTRLRPLFASDAAYNEYRRAGHKHFLTLAAALGAPAGSAAAAGAAGGAGGQPAAPAGAATEAAKAAAAAAHRYYTAGVVDTLVAARLGDYLIGVGSSGVSQLAAQLMGGARRADGNAFAVWQEDALRLDRFDVLARE